MKRTKSHNVTLYRGKSYRISSLRIVLSILHLLIRKANKVSGNRPRRLNVVHTGVTVTVKNFFETLKLLFSRNLSHNV